MEGRGITEEAREAMPGEMFGASITKHLDFEEGHSVWKDVSDAAVIREECSAWILEDPYLSLLVRCDDLESVIGTGAHMENGIRVKMDEGERKTMAKHGTSQTGNFMRNTIALHLERKFTDAMATDGIKAGNRAAYGVWEGPAGMDGTWEEKRKHDTGERIAAGMTGGRLPDGYDVLDAELAAIVVALH
jgi:hypothetical protein